MPFMHVHDHEDKHDHCHEHKDSDPLHTDETCPACVFLNSQVDFIVQPPTTTTQFPCSETPTIAIATAPTFNPIVNIRKRAPPVFPK